MTLGKQKKIVIYNLVSNGRLEKTKKQHHHNVHCLFQHNVCAPHVCCETQKFIHGLRFELEDRQ